MRQGVPLRKILFGLLKPTDVEAGGVALPHSPPQEIWDITATDIGVFYLPMIMFLLASLLVSTYSRQSYAAGFASRFVESDFSVFLTRSTVFQSLKLPGCSAVNIRMQLAVVSRSFDTRGGYQRAKS